MTNTQTLTGRAWVPEWTVGDRLRKAREDSNIGSQEMADRIGRSRSTVGRYERAESLEDLDLLVIRAYAMETGASYKWLITGIAPEGGEPITEPVTLGEACNILRGNFGTCDQELQVLKLTA